MCMYTVSGETLTDSIVDSKPETPYVVSLILRLVNALPPGNGFFLSVVRLFFFFKINIKNVFQANQLRVK